MRRLGAIALAVVATAACSKKRLVNYQLPVGEPLSYRIKRWASGRLQLASGKDEKVKTRFEGLLRVRRYEGGWRAAFARAVQAVEAPAESGIERDPGALDGLSARWNGQLSASVDAEARSPASITSLVAPLTPLLLVSFPPMPTDAVKRGFRWERSVPVSWPHPAGKLSGLARIKGRFSAIRPEGEDRLAVMRFSGNVELRNPKIRAAPSFRGALVADVLVSLGTKRLVRVVVQDQWVAATRDAMGRDIRLKARGEWSLRLTARKAK